MSQQGNIWLQRHGLHHTVGGIEAMNNVEGEQQHERSAGNVWRACLQRASLSALAA
jgi:hypothetical protein